MNHQVLLLMGSTAVGKTNLALELAKTYPLEIISVDSALIYREMDIGTAKPNALELASVPHHLIDIINPNQEYNVGYFVSQVQQLIPQILKRGKLPLLVGGTIMYYNALLSGLSKLPPSNPLIRTQLEDQLDIQGLEKLYAQLQQVDPVSASKINANDKQRIMRALEVYAITGSPLSHLQSTTPKNSLLDNYKVLSLSIIPNNREELHRRINQRFIKMLEDGFVIEVINLRNKYQDLTKDSNSMRTVGYAQVWQYLDKQITYQELIEQGQASTRQLAKRQITWLRQLQSINLLNGNLDIDDLLKSAINQIGQFIK